MGYGKDTAVPDDVGGSPDDDDPMLARALGFTKLIGQLSKQTCSETQNVLTTHDKPTGHAKAKAKALQNEQQQASTHLTRSVTCECLVQCMRVCFLECLGFIQICSCNCYSCHIKSELPRVIPSYLSSYISPILLVMFCSLSDLHLMAHLL